MTPKQQTIYNLIKSYYKKHGFPCAKTWLASQVGVTKSTMQDHVASLIKKGLVRQTPDGKPYPTPK